jgi:hypothetical protein
LPHDNISITDVPLSRVSFAGFYEPLRNWMNRTIGRDPKEQVFATSIAAGAGSGIVGGEKVPLKHIVPTYS